MTRKPMSFLVTLTPPARATEAALRAYVQDAVESMKGCYYPEDPISDLDYHSVKVTKVKS